MPSTEHDRSAPVPAPSHGTAFAATFEPLRHRSMQVRRRPHRAISTLRITPYLIAQATVLPAIFCTLLVWGRHDLFDIWREVILFWSKELGVPLVRVPLEGGMGPDGMALSAGAYDRPLPGLLGMGCAAVAVVAMFWVSSRLRDDSLPLKYPLRIVAVVQAVALAFFVFAPTQFPHTISRHSEELLVIGYATMVAVPVMLAAGYYLLNESLWSKLAHTCWILAFFALFIPHQVMAHAWILHHLSVLYMPVLYLCFGAVFDAMVFVALYSWAISGVSPHAAQ